MLFSEEHEMLRRQVRRFVETEIIPNGEKWEREGNVPREFIKRMGELGFLGIGFPEAYGGSAMDISGWVVLAEELGRIDVELVAHVAIDVSLELSNPRLQLDAKLSEVRQVDGNAGHLHVGQDRHQRQFDVAKQRHLMGCLELLFEDWHDALDQQSFLAGV